MISCFVVVLFDVTDLNMQIMVGPILVKMPVINTGIFTAY